MPVFSPSETAFFERNGFVIARNLAAHGFCERIKSLAQRHLAQAVQPVEYEAQTKYPGSLASLDAPGGRTVRRLLQAYSRDPLFGDWATSRAIGDRIRPLLGPQVELSQAHHNCVMTKNPAFGSATSWHQDIRYWSFEKPELISAWLALGQEHEEYGRLLHAAGRNRTGLTKFAAVFTYHDVGNRPLRGTRSASLPEIPLRA